MGTAVARSQDCLRNRLSSDAFRSSPQAKAHRNGHASRPSRSSPPPAKPGRDTFIAAATNIPHTANNNARLATRNPNPSPAKPGRSPYQVRGGGRRNRGVEDLDVRQRMVVKLPVKSLVMEEVTILKRGEPMKQIQADLRSDGQDKPVKDGDDGVFSSTVRWGPEPEILPKQIRLVDQKGAYAGAGFVTSPSPSCLPFPVSFFAKKELVDKADLATKGLRYLLRMDLQ